MIDGIVRFRGKIYVPYGSELRKVILMDLMQNHIQVT